MDSSVLGWKCGSETEWPPSAARPFVNGAAPGTARRQGNLYQEFDDLGFAHPRRFGIASHLGLFFDKPTIGCAKSRLTGTYEEPAPEKGAYSPLQDGNEIIGAVVRTRTNVDPIFVSVGNKCLLEDAIKITLDCITKYRIPEPTRLAHQLVSKLKLKT